MENPETLNETMSESPLIETNKPDYKRWGKVLLAVIVVSLLIWLIVWLSQPEPVAVQAPAATPAVQSAVLSPAPTAPAALVAAPKNPSGLPCADAACNTAWTCLSGLNTPLRVNAAGDVQCMALNGRDCAWQSTPENCQNWARNVPSNLNPSTCTSSLYTNPAHWCSVGKKAFYKL